MNDKPILFSAPMIRALLEGRKTQTRRIVKPSNGLQSEWASVEGLSKCPTNYLCSVDNKLGAQFQHPLAGTRQSYGDVSKDSPYGWFKCPYGKPGDLLWVRETFWHWGRYVKNGFTKTGKQAFKFKPSKFEGNREKVRFSDPGKAAGMQYMDWHKRPSIFLPRWASRITLEIKDIRVERVRDISEEDAKAEGVEAVISKKIHGWEPYSLEFSLLWQSINGPDSWDENPWVWVVEFEAHQCNIDNFIAAKDAA